MCMYTYTQTYIYIPTYIHMYIHIYTLYIYEHCQMLSLNKDGPF